MSKKNKFKDLPKQQPEPVKIEASHAGEYSLIKSDLQRLLFLNIIYLGILLLIYYTNNQSKYLDKMFKGMF